MARDWTSRVSELNSDVMKLVHLACRMDSADVEKYRGELLSARRRAYEDEISIQAARAGCPGRTGRLAAGPSLSELNEMSRADAESIVATYNYDLAAAIETIRAETPRANRFTYVSRLATWDEARSKWKAVQIATYTEGTARALAQADFMRLNNLDGTARLEPDTAVCPVCQGWLRRGSVPLKEAMASSPPYHSGCPHIWATKPERIPAGECSSAWVGEG